VGLVPRIPTVSPAALYTPLTQQGGRHVFQSARRFMIRSAVDCGRFESSDSPAVFSPSYRGHAAENEAGLTVARTPLTGSEVKQTFGKRNPGFRSCILGTAHRYPLVDARCACLAKSATLSL
jgi:hypothetical protein